MELLSEVGIVRLPKLQPLITEAYELVRIFSASQSTTRRTLAQISK